MKKVDFNKDWMCKCLTREEVAYEVTLPHDAMRSEPRTEESTGEGNIGWYIGGDYEYTKKFSVPKEYENKKLVLEFESVYRNAEVYINEEKAAFRPYGYTNFYVEINDFLRYGEENVIRVVAHNADQPNSRWYSGTGIYRPVYLYIGEENYIPVNGVKIRTTDYKTGEIEVKVETCGAGVLQVEILDGENNVYSVSEEVEVQKDKESQKIYDFQDKKSLRKKEKVSTEEGIFGERIFSERTFRIKFSEAKLWSSESPFLYNCRVTFGNDIVCENFGIRGLDWNPQEGLTINGQRVILRGACIHHDHGILGACTYPEAEERRIRILKENGYNAVRSSHYPCSKAMLDACDKQGMLVMDEYVDVWYIHKTKYDYADYLADWWQQDLKDMVEKDYNHPSVIMYSTGNEVAETAQKKGIALTQCMTDRLHKLDPTRPVTCGINIFFNFLSSMGMGVYSDEKAEKAANTKSISDRQNLEKQAKKNKKPVGSEFYNTLACLAGDYFMKIGATLPPCDWKTKDAYAAMDIAGYNYGLFRYKHDLKKYPDRLILGSETFCKDAYSFWEIAKKNKRIIGDFVWAGWDYIGETGDGAAEYSDYKGKEPHTRMTGNNGRIDLLGKPRAEAAYTRVAFEQAAGPFIAVKPVYQKENLRLTGWALTKALESWSWRGCSGEKTEVEVFARAAEVELLINGKSAGRKPVKKCRVKFDVVYEDGEITAVSYDANGTKMNRQTLKTAAKETTLSILPEKNQAKKGELLFIPLQYTDNKGIWKPMEKHTLKVKVENGTLEGLGSANSYKEGNYTQDTTETYYGEAMAAVRSDGNGPVKILVSDENTVYTCEIPLF